MLVYMDLHMDRLLNHFLPSTIPRQLELNPNQKLFKLRILNNLISEYIFKYLKDNGIDNHFIERLNNREQLNPNQKL